MAWTEGSGHQKGNVRPSKVGELELWDVCCLWLISSCQVQDMRDWMWEGCQLLGLDLGPARAMLDMHKELQKTNQENKFIWFLLGNRGSGYTLLIISWCLISLTLKLRWWFALISQVSHEDTFIKVCIILAKDAEDTRMRLSQKHPETKA